MATALDMIKRSMRLIGALGDGETPNANEQSDGLSALNSMLESWSIQSLNIYQVQSESFTWAAGSVSQTIGPGGDFDTVRPIEIESMFQRYDFIDYPIHDMQRQNYDHVPDKDTQSTLIGYIYADMAFPLATLYAYPVPSEAATIFIQSWQPMQSFATALTEVSMPPGYREAIEHNLAVIMAPEYQRVVPPQVFRHAVNSLRTIKQRNTRIPSSVVEPASLSSRRGLYDYRTGD